MEIGENGISPYIEIAGRAKILKIRVALRGF